MRGCLRCISASVKNPGSASEPESGSDGGAIDSNHSSRFTSAPAMNLVGDQFLSRSGFTQNENRSFRRRDEVDLPDDLSEGGALTDKIAEGFRFHHLLVQVSVLEFELCLEPLDLLKGPRVGDGGADVVGEDPAPGSGFWGQHLAREPGQHP